MHLKYSVVLIIFCSLCFRPVEMKSIGIESVIRFGDSLFQHTHYDQALHEYQRALCFSTDTVKSRLSAKIADCYFAMEDFNMARNYYDSAICYATAGQVNTDLEFQKIRCLMMEGKFGVALLRLHDLEAGTDSSLHRRKSLYQGICCFGTGQFEEMQKHLLNSLPQKDSLRIQQLQELLEERKILNRPDPKLALVMSIVLPGVGQVYAGDIKAGLNSLFLLGGLVYMGTSGVLTFPLITIPFIHRYYLGGIMHASEIAENRRNSIRYEYYMHLGRVLPAGESYIHLFEPEAQKKFYPVNLRSSDSEIEILLKIGYLGYKEFLSSQDVDACVFHPSCSNYTIEAIEIKGVVAGLLEGFDRVSRCHPFVGRHDYPYDTRTMKYHDPL